MLQLININTYYVSDVLSEFLLRISDIDVKYSFNSIAIFSDFVMFLSSIINSSGSVFKDFLLSMDRKCCQMDLGLVELLMESEKYFLFADLIKVAVLFW